MIIKKFYPSEFGMDVERSLAVEPAKAVLAIKAHIHRIIEAEKIPYTYIISNGFAGYFLSTLGQQGVTVPPRDKVISLGDGNTKGKHNFGFYTYQIFEYYQFAIVCHLYFGNVSNDLYCSCYKR